jgi:hypothetical protein
MAADFTPAKSFAALRGSRKLSPGIFDEVAANYPVFELKRYG